MDQYFLAISSAKNAPSKDRQRNRDGVLQRQGALGTVKLKAPSLSLGCLLDSVSLTHQREYCSVQPSGNCTAHTCIESGSIKTNRKDCQHEFGCAKRCSQGELTERWVSSLLLMIINVSLHGWAQALVYMREVWVGIDFFFLWRCCS